MTMTVRWANVLWVQQSLTLTSTLEQISTTGSNNEFGDENLR